MQHIGMASLLDIRLIQMPDSIILAGIAALALIAAWIVQRKLDEE